MGSSRPVRGTAEIFYVSRTQGYGIIHHSAYKERVLPEDLDNVLGTETSLVFMTNTNLHALPHQCRGALCILWYKKRLRLAIVVQASSSTLESTFIIQKDFGILPSFWTLPSFPPADHQLVSQHFFVKTFHSSSIFCRLVNQIHGPRLKLILPVPTQSVYPWLSNDGKYSMRVTGPDISKSPSSETIRKLLHLRKQNLPDAPPSLFHSPTKPALSKTQKGRLKKRPKPTVPVLYVQDTPYRCGLICTCTLPFAPGIPRHPDCKCPSNPIPRRSFVGIPIPSELSTNNCQSDKYSIVEIVEVPKDIIFKSEAAPLTIPSFLSLIKGHPRKTLLVPKVNQTLRIKLVSLHEWNALEAPAQETDRFQLGGFKYQFSFERSCLDSTPGLLVSVWKQEDPAVMKTILNYEYGISLYEVFKEGFGARAIADCGGVNAYRACTNSKRAHPTPSCGEEQTPKQQYYRASQSFPLTQALLEKKLHDQTNEIIGSAYDSNRSVMKVLGHYCETAIATCGSPPSCRKEHKNSKGTTVIQKERNNTPTLGFFNDLHIDCCDRASSLNQSRFLLQCHQYPNLQRMYDRVGLGLPTTCGYQFLKNKIFLEHLIPIQYFSCDGLGLAVRIDHGHSHHFLGWVFAHHTSLCILYDPSNGLIYINNKQNLFMVYAWGRTGGDKEIRVRSPQQAA